ncbi:hypothetical protein Vafri_9370 [Volvox africanus]|uniref:Uncharacterized protein n=1 Tax=Volvox africanus TaxID=51714 RepID=A0A8J4EZR5_9CHLO|nr:hypothetical protein Vafri_9370 [Volvox africanus]
MDIYVIASLVAAAMSAMAAFFSLIVAWWSYKEARYSRLAELQKGYGVVRSNNRIIRRLMRDLGCQTPDELALWYYRVSIPSGDSLMTEALGANKQLANSDRDGAHVQSIEVAMDEVAAFWDVLVAGMVDRLLPRSFRKNGGEWNTRARRYILLYEPLHVANWYIHETQFLYEPANTSTDIPQKSWRPYKDKRPNRFIKLEEFLYGHGVLKVRGVSYERIHDRIWAQLPPRNPLMRA